MTRDKQLRSVNIRLARSKQNLDQALNVKEFAVLAGISYSVAREWFQLAGFPAICGKVFWQDFVLWRRGQRSPKIVTENQLSSATSFRESPGVVSTQWSPKAAKILSES
jgi:hypothetical protein